MGSSIVQLDCKTNNVTSKQDWLKKIHKGAEDSWIFNKSTGEYYEYSDFYEKLVLLDGVDIRDGAKGKFKSTIVNNKFKVSYEFIGFLDDLDEESDYYEYEINLKDLTIKTTGDLGGGDKFTSTGTCKYGEPESTEVFQDNEKPT